MEIIHRISFNAKRSPAFVEELDRIGILEEQDIDTETQALLVIEFSESDPRWNKIHYMKQQDGGLHTVQTIFTDDEISASEVVRLYITHQEGYPQPKDTWVSTKPNYEVRCRVCGIYRQTEPFSIEAEPRLQSNGFMTLTWGSALFVSNQVIQTLVDENITGFQPWDVLIHNTGKPSENIQQLKLFEHTAPGLRDREEIGYEVCEACGERKYFAHSRGAMRYQRDACQPDRESFQAH